MGKNRANKPKVPVSGKQKFGIVALAGMLCAALVGLGNSVDAVGKICKDDLFAAACKKLGRHEPPDKLIAALDSKNPVELASALTKLKDLVHSHPAHFGQVAVPFAVYFNARYQQVAAPAVKPADDPVVAGLSLQLLSALAQARPAEAGATRLEISNVDLQRSNLAGMRLPGVGFTNVLLHDANLEGADLRGAVITRSRFDRVQAAKLLAAGAQWRQTCLEGAQLQGADFARAQLADVDMNSTDLSAANFAGSSIERVRFSGALLDNTGFAGAKVTAVSGFVTVESEEGLKAASTPSAVVFARDTKSFGQCY